jgi:hypothetical protein
MSLNWLVITYAYQERMECARLELYSPAWAPATQHLLTALLRVCLLKYNNIYYYFRRSISKILLKSIIFFTHARILRTHTRKLTSTHFHTNMHPNVHSRHSPSSLWDGAVYVNLWANWSFDGISGEFWCALLFKLLYQLLLLCWLFIISCVCNRIKTMMAAFSFPSL